MQARHVDLRLRIPGFRRYARDRERLRIQAEELEQLRTRLATVERQAAALAARAGLAEADPAAGSDEWAARARRYEYYWANAEKKIDLLAMRPFGPLARRVLEEGRTFLNVDRLYTLWQGVMALPADAAAVAEVGVFKGGSARLVAEAMQLAGRMHPFYACDTFAGHTVVDEALDGRHRVGKQFRSKGGSLAPRVQKYLSRYDFLHVLEGDIRDTAAQFSDEQRFGLVHIDVDVHPITQFCLEFFASRVVVGATIVVDDYGFVTCHGAKVAVDEFVAAHRDRFWAMHLLTGQAVLTRVR